MYSTNRAVRRLSLLAGSSLIAAGLSAAGGIALAPGAAHAQATCASPPAPAGNGTNSVVIAAGTYNPGITCTYLGTDATVSTAGNVTVSNMAGGDGVNLSATGSDAVNWNSSAGTVTGQAQTNGPVIDATSESGDIDITTAAVTGTQAGVTHGVRAISTGGGDITISRATGNISNTSAAGQAAISAVTNGGDISISGSGVSGRLRGILAQTSGGGSVELDLASTADAHSVNGVVAIDVTAGTGGATIMMNGANGGAGMALVVASTGGAVVSNIGNVIGAVDFSGVAAGGTTFTTTQTGRWVINGASVFSGGADTVSIGGTGTSTMAPGSTVTMGAGDDVLNLSALLAVTDAAIDFGAGADAFNLTGDLSINGAFTVTNLETFENAGLILLGAFPNVSWNSPVPVSYNYSRTDGAGDDVFVMHGGVFGGSGGGRVVVDASLSDGEQIGCAALTGAADCLDLRGASTDGVTLITVSDFAPEAAPGAYTPGGITIVDVSGAGTSAAGHFVLDPDSDGYVADPTFGGAIDRPGLFRYALRYDAANQRHSLVGLPRAETMEYALLSGATHSIWHMTAETVTDRQVDLREAPGGGSVWMRASGEYTKRDVATNLTVFGDSFTFDNSYKLYAGTLLAGLDLLSGETGTFEYVVGAQIGYVGSSFDLTASPSSGRFTGATGGLYASLWNGRAFLDGALNFNGLTLDYDSPGLGAKTNTFLNAVGLRLDAGTRMSLTEAVYVEPLASFAFVRTGFEEISLFGGEVKPEDSKSARGALGLRIGGDVAGQAVNASYYLTGRAWNEFEGQSTGSVVNPGAPLPFAADLSGAFGEAEAGISLFNTANTLSGFATTGVAWKDGYSAIDLSLGLRMAW